MGGAGWVTWLIHSERREVSSFIALDANTRNMQTFIQHLICTFITLCDTMQRHFRKRKNSWIPSSSAG